MNTSTNRSSQNARKVLPSVGVALTPVKQAASPTKSDDQYQASLIRASIKRFKHMLFDNAIIEKKDLDLTRKTAELREELRQE